MATLWTMNQPGGAGNAGLGNDIIEVRAGVDLVCTAQAAGSYDWELLNAPIGEVVTVEDSTTQVATISFPEKPFRYKLRLSTPDGATIRIIEVSRDSAGELIGSGAVPLAEDEQKFMSPAHPGGAATADERRMSRIASALESAGGVEDAPAAGVFGAEAAGPGEWFTTAGARTLLDVPSTGAVASAISAAVGAEASTRGAADIALDGRLDIVEADLTAATDNATADEIVRRDGNADAEFRYVRGERLYPVAAGSNLSVAAALGTDPDVDASGVLRISLGKYVGGESSGVAFYLANAGDPWSIPALTYKYTTLGNTIVPLGAFNLNDASGYGVTLQSLGSLDLAGNATTRIGGGGSLILIFGTQRAISRYYYADGVVRANERYQPKVATSSTTETVIFSYAVPVEPGTHDLVVKSRRTTGNSDNSTAIWRVRACVYQDSSGDAVIIGTPIVDALTPAALSEIEGTIQVYTDGANFEISFVPANAAARTVHVNEWEDL